MNDLSFVVSLVNQDNDYQRAQAVAAEDTARRLGVSLKILFAGGDGIEQSQQLLNIIQTSSSSSVIRGIILQPAGTGLPHVARAAAAAGMGWVVLHRHVDYTAELRKTYNVPVFMVSSDHGEAGRIQGRQVAALLPRGGMVLYITGPATDPISEQRLAGMNHSKPSNVQVLTIRGKWTDQSGYDAISSWLRLSTSQQQSVGVIASQNDVMAMGAKRALKNLANGAQREQLLKVPIIGCDGLSDSGQVWVRQGLLTATVILPVVAGMGVEMLAKAIQTGKAPAEHTVADPTSCPALEKLG